MHFVLLMLAPGLLTELLVDDLTPIAPPEAIQHIGKPQVLMEMTVRSAKDRLEKRDIIYRDSEYDFTDPSNHSR